MQIKLTYALLVLIALAGCEKHRVSNVKEYLSYLADERNGLEKTRYVNGIELKVRYLPPEYLAYLEWENNMSYTEKQKDSLLRIYKNSINFRLSIGPDERSVKGGDIMFQGVADYKAYVERSMAMNFEMAEYITLSAGSKIFKPALSAMENIYGLDSKRNILLVFNPENETEKQAMEQEQLEFKYADELFQLGTNYFVFHRKDINNIPAFPIR